MYKIVVSVMKVVKKLVILQNKRDALVKIGGTLSHKIILHSENTGH